MRRFRRTTLITAACFAVLAGLGLSRKLSLEPNWLLVIFAPLLLLLKKKNVFSLLLVIVAGLGIGMWRGGIYMQKLNGLKDLTGHAAVIEATARTDSVYSAKSQLEFTASDVYLVEPGAKPLAGTFKISGFGIPMVYRGDRVRISGKIYPMRGANQARIAYAQLQLVHEGNGWLARATRAFSTGMQNSLPEPQASFALGLLVGQRTNLPQDIITQLTMVGLVHIVAVSGYNLTIIVRSMQRLRIQSKYQRTLLSMALIVTFVLITGFSASIVRAAVISMLSLWAWYYGRNIKPLLLIVFSAAVTALHNPFYIWSDLGWYLSFLAFFGVLIIAPLIVARVFSKQPKLLTLVLIETLCAEIMTLPLIMMIFGQMSLVALIANLLIVPLVPAAMLLAAIAGLSGVFIPQLAGWLAWPAQLMLTYILDIVHMMAAIPSIFLHVSISPNFMICSYALVLIFVLTLYHRVKGRTLASQSFLNTLEVLE
jgi:competence protein ComEC